jgi:hypothetical protein
MNNNNYVLELLINGRPAKELYHDGKVFIESRDGTEYVLRFRNNSWKRVLAQFSVDGIEVIGGKVAGEDKMGYIVDAYSSIEVKGYRIDDSNVAAFKFGDSGKSYAVKVGGKKIVNGKEKQIKTSKNNGIIGVRVFEEKLAPVYPQITLTNPVSIAPWTFNSIINSNKFDDGHIGTVCNDYYAKADNNFEGILRSCSMNSKNTASAYNCSVQPSAVKEEVPSFDMGTTWGTKIQDGTYTIDFKSVDYFTDLQFYYASRPVLESYGVRFTNEKKIAWPQAFDKNSKYCKVPEGY